MVAEHRYEPSSGGWKREGAGSRFTKWKSCKAEASPSAEGTTSCFGRFGTLRSDLQASFRLMSGERHIGHVIYVYLKPEDLYLPLTWENSQACPQNPLILPLQLHYSPFLDLITDNGFPPSLVTSLSDFSLLYLSIIIFQKFVPAQFFNSLIFSLSI